MKTEWKFHLGCLLGLLVAAAMSTVLFRGLACALRSRPAPAVASAASAPVRGASVDPAPRPASEQRWRRVWTLPAGSGLEGEPAAGSNLWVAATERDRLLAFDDDGRVLWNRTVTNLYLTGSPAVAGDTALWASVDGRVLAVELATGRDRWQVTLPAAFRHGPLALRDGPAWRALLLSGRDGRLHCLDAASGAERWVSPETGQSDGAPGRDGRLVAYGNCSAKMYVYETDAGRPVAQIPVGAGVVSGDEEEMPDGVMAGPTLVSQGRIYGGTGGGELVCGDVAASTVVWRATIADSEAFNAPVAVGDLVLMSSREGAVAAWSARDGAERWRLSLSNRVDKLCPVDDAVFAVVDGKLVGLRANDGREFLRMAVGDRVAGPVWNGRVLVVADDGGNIIGFRGR
jgi:outer membrane protein assembly factor BamB